jgi:transposase, IS30 family
VKPEEIVEMVASYQHVTRDIRCQIYALKSTGTSLREIAKSVEKHVSTISRELSRNTGGRGYRYNQADIKAKTRRSAASRIAKKLTLDVEKRVVAGIEEDWSPEQLSGRLAVEGTWISYETIYRHVWKDKRSGGLLYKHLRHHGKRYNKRGASQAGRGCIPDRIDIKERPAIVETKSRIGDWEGDTIIGAKHKGAIVSYVDRHSKYTLLKKIGRKQAAQVTEATVEKMRNLPHPVLSITYDNGKEFAQHKVIAKALKTSCYFATPYHSWERGLNEHTNGLVRQYLPKSTQFTKISDQQIQTIEDKLNHRPRKVLQYKTPFEVFFAKQKLKLTVALHC